MHANLFAHFTFNIERIWANQFYFYFPWNHQKIFSSFLFLLVTSCLVVTVQPCMEGIPIKKKQILMIKESSWNAIWSKGIPGLTKLKVVISHTTMASSPLFAGWNQGFSQKLTIGKYNFGYRVLSFEQRNCLFPNSSNYNFGTNINFTLFSWYFASSLVRFLV